MIMVQKKITIVFRFFSPSGVYLFIIAVVDLRTQGVYFNYAIDWQHG